MDKLNLLGILAIGMGAMFANNTTALASPDAIVAQVGVRGVQNRVNAPKSLTITPPPGSHIPLPESNYNSSNNYHYHYHHHEHYHRQRDRGTTIIINPPVYNTPRNRVIVEPSPSENRYIKIIRRRSL